MKQFVPLCVQVPHQGDVFDTRYAALAQAWQSEWHVGSGGAVGLNVGLAVGLAVGLGDGDGVTAAGFTWPAREGAGVGFGWPGTQSLSMRSDANSKP